MIDRRGHRKLRLSSKKHFKPKLKQRAPVIARVIDVEATPKKPTCLEVSLPADAYINAPVSSISNLQDRLERYGGIPSGILIRMQLAVSGLFFMV